MASCTKSGCHQEQKKWSEQEEQAPNRHKDAFDQVTRDPAKSSKYAASIGLTDPQSPTGRCVECHAPRNTRFFKEGVSCEVCHGAGSRYELPHDDEPYMTVGYVKAQGLGMPAFINNPQAWVERCVTCHVMTEAALIAAGHPSGGCLAEPRSRDDQKRCDAENFDLSVKYKIVSSPNGNHWKTKYDARLNEIKQLAKKFGDPLMMTRTKAAPPVITAAIATTTTAAAAPAATTPTPPVSPALPPTVAGGVASTTTLPGRSTSPTATAPMGARGGGARGGVPAQLSIPIMPVTSFPPVTPTVPPAAKTPPPDAIPPTVAVVGLPRSPAALVAAVQGRAIALLNSLLTRGAVVPARVRPLDPIQYNGPDAELLRLQREALALALDALGAAPKASPAAKP